MLFFEEDGELQWDIIFYWRFESWCCILCDVLDQGFWLFEINLCGFQGGRGFKVYGEEVDVFEFLLWDNCDEFYFVKESYFRRYEVWWEGESYVFGVVLKCVVFWSLVKKMFEVRDVE